MSELREAAQAALDALEAIHAHNTRYGTAKRSATATTAKFQASPLSELAELGYMAGFGHKNIDAIAALRAALAAPETAEPVAWQARYIGPDAQTNQWSLCTAADADELVKRPDTYQVRPLYAHPPRDDWRDVQPPTEGA